MAEKIDAEALQFGQMLQRYRESAKVAQQEIADAIGLTKNWQNKKTYRADFSTNRSLFVFYFLN